MRRISIIWSFFMLLPSLTKAWLGFSSKSLLRPPSAFIIDGTSVGMLSGDDRSGGLDEYHNDSLEQTSSVEESTTVFPQFFLNESSSEIDKGTIKEFDIELLEPWEFKTRHRYVMVIGTVHISNHSAQQVERYIELVRPDSVVIELDILRFPPHDIPLSTLHGIDNLVWYSYEYEDKNLTSTLLYSIQLCNVTDHESNQNPLERQSSIWQSLKSIPRSTMSFVRCKYNKRRRPTWKSFKSSCKMIACYTRDKCRNLAVFTWNRIAIQVYNLLTRLRGFEHVDMPAAIRASNKYNVSRLVLADRSSRQTIRSLLSLLGENERPFEILQKWGQINKELFQELRNITEIDEATKKSQIYAAARESLKTNPQILHRYMERNAKEIPPIYQAIAGERDILLTKAILHELENGAKRVVVVVGLGHVPGITSRLHAYSSQNRRASKRRLALRQNRRASKRRLALRQNRRASKRRLALRQNRRASKRTQE